MMTTNQSNPVRKKIRRESRSATSKQNTTVDYLQTYQRAGTLHEKLAIAMRWSQIEPTLSLAWFCLGEVSQEAGDSTNALLAYKTARDINPNDIPTLGRLADLCFKRGDFIEAFNCYQHILGKDAPPAWAFVGMGNVVEKLEDRSAALDHLLKAIELEPEYLVTLAGRILAMFEALPIGSKIRYLLTIQALLNRLESCNKPIKSLDASHIVRFQRLCDVLQKFSNLIDFSAQSRASATKFQQKFSQPDNKGIQSLSSFLERLCIHIDGIRHGHLNAKVTGWPGDSLAASLIIDGEIVGPVSFQPTYSDEDHGNRLHASINIPEKFLDAQPHLYYLQIEMNTHPFRSEPVILRYPEYKLKIDSYDHTSLEGWCCNISTNNCGDLVACDAHGNLLAILTHIPRPDVTSHFENLPLQTGFKVQLTPSWPAGSQLIFLRDSDNDIVVAEISIASRYNALLDAAQQWAVTNQPTHYAQLSAVASALVNETSHDLMISTRLLPKIRCESGSSEVAVIIPVYRGLLETIECIESVLAAENETPSKTIIINDNSPEPLITNYLRVLERRRIPGLLVIHRRQNGGFSVAVNAGILLAGGRDVVLLNSDTVVQSGWLDRLARAAYSDTRIGTVTPLSNNAEICTVPYTCKSLPINRPELAVEIDQTAVRVNTGRIQDIPVAIGFCVYIKRACLDQIGLFDDATWGRGYGEEVDFCLKAAAIGWRHVMTGDTFVVHRGNVSFGDEKIRRIEESAKKINERYPFYDNLIQRYLSMDPAAPIRRNINLALLAAALPPNRILHVTHNYGGGTEQYIKDQCIFNKQDGYTPIVLRFNDYGRAEMTVKPKGTRLEDLFAVVHKEGWTLGEIEHLKQDLLNLRFERLHLHSPFGMPMVFLDWLVDTFPTQITIHDYSWICPRVTLTQAGARYCQEPPVEQCNRCVKFNPPHSGLKHFLLGVSDDVDRYRQFFARILAKAEIVYTGAQDIVNRMQRHGVQANYKAVPYAHPEGSIFLKPVSIPDTWSKDGIIRLALIGGLSDIKGFYQLIDCAEESDRRHLPIEFIVFGKTMDDSQLLRFKNIKVLGPYKEEELENLMLIYKPRVAFFPNQWPETYSYTLTHALRFGLYPIVTDIGAPAERISKAGVGTLIPLGISAKNICEIILKLPGSQ